MKFLSAPARRQLPRLLSLGALAALALSATAAKRPYRPVEPLPAGTFIDLHCHTAGIGAGGSGCHISDDLRRSYKLAFYLRSFGVTERELREHGDALVLERLSARLARSERVGRAVVLALDGVVDAHGQLDLAHTEVYVPNEFLAAEIPKHPNLLWGASVNPHRPDALARLEWAKAHGAVLVKWLPSIQHIDPADERLVPFYRKLVELQLPLLVHTGDEHSFTRAENHLGDPDRLRLPLREGVTVIAAHAATTGKIDGARCFDRLARLLPEYPNLYADISSLTQLNKRAYLAELLQRPEFAHRLLYGTDYPLVEIRALVSPWHFPRQLTLRQRWQIAHLSNPWDRDVALKQALGFPADSWTLPGKLLRPDLPVASAPANAATPQRAKDRAS